MKKEDLDLVNHLSGKTQKYLKLSFRNVKDLNECKWELLPVIKKNKAEKMTHDAYEGWYNQGETIDRQKDSYDYFRKIVDIREYDVLYHIRCQIDNEIRVSFWYQFTFDGQMCTKMEQLKNKLDKADLRVMAYDIETTKQTLKFPDVNFD